MNERDGIFRERMMALIVSHAKHSSKVISNVRVKWTRCARHLAVNAYSFEYENKP